MRIRIRNRKRNKSLHSIIINNINQQIKQIGKGTHGPCLASDLHSLCNISHFPTSGNCNEGLGETTIAETGKIVARWKRPVRTLARTSSSCLCWLNYLCKYSPACDLKGTLMPYHRLTVPFIQYLWMSFSKFYAPMALNGLGNVEGIFI